MARDPLTTTFFKIEIEGKGALVFSECSGLKNTTEVVELWEGGLNEFVHKFIGNTKSDNLVLKHGMGKGTHALYKLRESVIFSEVQSTFDGAVILMDALGEERWRWPFKNAYIVRWEGPVLKGPADSIAIETLEIACTLPSPPAPPPPQKPKPREKEEKDWITADFEPDPKEGLEGTEISFKDKSKCSKSITEWEWRCPSNRNWKSSDSNPKAVFKTEGNHAVSLMVTSSSGQTATTTRMVTIFKDFIEAQFEPADAIITVGEKVKFTDKSRASSKIKSWEWECKAVDWTSTDQNPEVEFKKPGTHTVILKATSESGKTDAVRHSVKVVPDCPQWRVRFSYTQSSNSALPHQYTVELPSKGPNGENLAFIDWDFGPELDRLGTRWVHQKRKHVVTFPAKNAKYTIKCGVRLQGYETCWYKMNVTLTSAKNKKGHSSWATVEPYEAPKGTLKNRV